MGANFPHYQDLGSWHKQPDGGGTIPEKPSLNTATYLKAVRVDGELLVLRCWACGTAHCVNVEQCAPEELALIICSKSDCRMSLFLVNELAVDEQSARLKRANERSSLFSALSWFWK